ncbi:MAG: hypothetical protein U0531_20675 [Dehalococcoidia bacterium]
MARSYTDQLAAALRRGRRRSPVVLTQAKYLTDQWAMLIRAGSASATHEAP